MSVAVATAIDERIPPTRRLSFEESRRTLPRYFAGDGDLIGSHLGAALSSVFPDGEEFFVRSVRKVRSQIDDPTLRRQVAGFIGQEATHGREHRLFNERLHELGYPVRRYERFTDWYVRHDEVRQSEEWNLAVTAALEHFTATLAELVLRHEDARFLLGDDGLGDAFLWHALEESEHKAVAFDVYRAIGGSEANRVKAMRRTRVRFLVVLGGMTVLSLLRDRRTYRRGELRKSWRTLRRSGLLSRELWRTLKDYDRPGFHPDDHDTDDLVAQWRTRLFGADGTLTDQLIGARASA